MLPIFVLKAARLLGCFQGCSIEKGFKLCISINAVFPLISVFTAT